MMSGCVTEVIGAYPEPAPKAERLAAQLRLARGYYRLGEYKRARLAADRMLALGTRQSADGYEVLALIEAASGRPEAAVTYFKKAIRKQKSNGRIWNNYGVFLYERGDFKAACPAFHRALADPNYARRKQASRNLVRCQQAQTGAQPAAATARP